jgi:hypothetical protein
MDWRNRVRRLTSAGFVRRRLPIPAAGAQHGDGLQGHQPVSGFAQNGDRREAGQIAPLDAVEQGRTGGPELRMARKVINQRVGIEDRRAGGKDRKEHQSSGGGG